MGRHGSPKLSFHLVESERQDAFRFAVGIHNPLQNGIRKRYESGHPLAGNTYADPQIRVCVAINGEDIHPLAGQDTSERSRDCRFPGSTLPRDCNFHNRQCCIVPAAL